jgi:hypothetical protein
MSPFLAVGLQITLYHLAGTLASLVNRHSVFSRHCSLGGISQ